MRTLGGWPVIWLLLGFAAAASAAEPSDRSLSQNQSESDSTAAESAGIDQETQASQAPKSEGQGSADAYVRESASLQQGPTTPPPPPNPYKDPFYDNDFRYLDDPDYVSQDPFDLTKRLQLLDDLTVTFGGESRWQWKSEVNRALGAPGSEDNHFNLLRNRVFLDTWYRERLRVYMEYIDAVSFGEDRPPLPIDENRSDLLNLFGEVMLPDFTEGTDSVRVGRQELLYGAQRLISPLEWGNTRRTFEGVKVLHRSPSFDIDFFWTRPVIVEPTSFDHPDHSRQFFGFYSTWRGIPQHSFDLYFLNLFESEDVVVGSGGPGDFQLYTLGGRWLGHRGPWHAEIEGAIQLGDFAGDDIVAGMFTAGAGHDLPLPLKPSLWIYYDLATGDEDPTDGQRGTFNQLFPLAHKYFGILDLVGRQNIQDLYLELTLRPHEKVIVQLGWSVFWLHEDRDALYNAAGLPVRLDATGAAGHSVGQELDIVTTILLNPHANLQFGYGHFYAGPFIARTGNEDDAEFFYTQVVVRY